MTAYSFKYASGDWNTGQWAELPGGGYGPLIENNWTPTGFPGLADTANIFAGSAVTINHTRLADGVAAQAGDLNLYNGATLSLGKDGGGLTVGTQLHNAGQITLNGQSGDQFHALTLTISGPIANDGTITASGASRIELTAAETTLAGGGELRLQTTFHQEQVPPVSFSDYAYLSSAPGLIGVLHNQSTISGLGVIGDIDYNGFQTHLALDNRAQGVVNARGSINSAAPDEDHSLVLFSRAGVTNAGLLESTGTAGLRIRSDVTQSGNGTILADGPGARVILGESNTSVVVQGGRLNTTNGGFIEIWHATLDGSTSSGSVVNLGNLVGYGRDPSTNRINGDLTLRGSIANSGSMAVHRVLIGAGDVTLSGSGTLLLVAEPAFSNPEITGYSTTTRSTLFNSSTIEGANTALVNGNIDDPARYAIGNGDAPGSTNLLRFVNQAAGVVDAVARTSMTIHTGVTVTNNGLFEADGGVMDVQDAVTGTGSALIIHGGDLRFDSTFNENVAFQGQNAGELRLTQPYSGTIFGLDRGDQLDLLGIARTSADHLTWHVNAQNTGGVLSVLNSSGTTLANLNLAGHHAASDFSISVDGSGHTLLSVNVSNANRIRSDFSGDGTSDLLLQNGSLLADWIMQNGTFQSGNYVTSSGLPAGWSVVGTGDFNADGTTDLLLRNGSSVADWIIQNGTFQSGNIVINSGLPAGWNVIGTGDFNGDGTSDLLLQNGRFVADWTLLNGTFQSGNLVTSSGLP
ncbi:MAG: hypothetical protein QOF94_3071, partial [Acidobacteriaceae bacterium]